ncbi:hypothetical protein CCAND38_230064 [Capnocytophaga canis]|uniref:Uncharacterized protein n=1 Tax=Capnocytophaga canis TaxID=1848903 RepID=A0A0B7I0X0_9FLAO|nr:hypothetical protein CCAND38_230064 [Capnocytophaga canis]
MFIDAFSAYLCRYKNITNQIDEVFVKSFVYLQKVKVLNITN